MALTAGSRLGPYEITALIGEGGMGKVWRAHHTALNRDDALKVLPDAFAADPDRLARFRREAQVLASLNHPNIAHVYGLEQADGVQALIMELVEGETLADRIARGPIPIDDALPIARQIAEALEAAHEQGIIHRDLKPANIKVRPDGTVKVLDFGLAKLAESVGSGQSAVGSPQASLSPTITSPALMTGVGVLLGTAAYMAPEQAKGKPADKRADIWAFGCVLYEMLTGRRAFGGEDVADTFANVIKADPDLAAIPGDLPQTVRALIRGCLRKDPRLRIGDVAAALFIIREPLDASAPLPVQPPLWRRIGPAVVTGIACAAIAGAAAWRLKPNTALPLTRFEILLDEGEEFALSAASRRLLAVSPDGSRIAYVTNRGLYVRALTDRNARRLVDATSQQGIQNPVFSPDSQSIAFYSVNEHALKRVAVTGGATATLGSSEAINGMSWGQDGLVYGVFRSGVMRLSPTGAGTETLVRAGPTETIVQPQLLPGGRAVLFTLAAATGALDFDRSQIVVQPVGSQQRKVLIDGGSDAWYLPTGHIVYALGGVLWAVPFNVSRLEVTGGPMSIVDGIARGTGFIGLATSQFSVSENGTLAYVPGPATTSGSNTRRTLVVIDTQGRTRPLPTPAAPYYAPRVSPDGSRLAVVTDDDKGANIWIYELGGGTSMRRLTFEGRNRFPVWSSDGQHVIFQSNREGDLGIWWQLADGSRPAERLTRADPGVVHIPEASIGHSQSFSFSVMASRTDASLWTFSLSNRKAEPFDTVRSVSPLDSAVSPDGGWMAYTMRGNGRVEVYVQPVPPTGAKYQVSGEGHHPLWSPDGNRLLYFPGAGPLTGVRVVGRPGFSFEEAEPVAGGFTSNTNPDSGRNHDFMPDGRVIAALSTAEATGSVSLARQINVALNWFEELKGRVPAK